MQGQLLRPRTIVTYDREALLYSPGNVRITIDGNLHTGLTSTDFLDSQLLHADASDTLAVLEVKYDAFPPKLVRLAVQTPDQRADAFWNMLSAGVTTKYTRVPYGH